MEIDNPEEHVNKELENMIIIVEKLQNEQKVMNDKNSKLEKQLKKEIEEKDEKNKRILKNFKKCNDEVKRLRELGTNSCDKCKNIQL